MLDPVFLAGLMQRGWRDVSCAACRDGVDVHYFYREDARPGTPVWVLLRYQASASAPLHRHTGLETIIVLEGSQSDERGRYCVGSLNFNPEGTVHRVWREDGCTVLIQWARPVKIPAIWLVHSIC